MKLGDIDKVINFYLKAKAYVEDIEDKESIIRIYIGLTLLYFNEQNYDKAFSSSELAKSNFEGIIIKI